MHTISVHAEPKGRTIRLRSAFAVGATAVAGAFGAGYVLAEALDDSLAATGATPRTASGHTFGAAASEALALKQPSAAGDRAADIRLRRIR